MVSFLEYTTLTFCLTSRVQSNPHFHVYELSGPLDKGAFYAPVAGTEDHYNYAFGADNEADTDPLWLDAFRQR